MDVPEYYINEVRHTLGLVGWVHDEETDTWSDGIANVSFWVAVVCAIRDGQGR